MDMNNLKEILTTAADKQLRKHYLRLACVGCGVADGRSPLTTGGLIEGDAKIYEVTKPFKIYRIFQKEKYEPGYWWLFKKPNNDKSIDDWRKENNVCASWNPAEKLAEAILGVGAIIVVGPGAESRCDAERFTYHESRALQIFLPKSSKKFLYDLTNIGIRQKSSRETFSWTAKSVDMVNHSRSTSAPPRMMTKQPKSARKKTKKPTKKGSI